MFAPQLRLFTCVKGPVEAVQQRACLPELTALLQVFGPYAAMRLCELTDAVVVDCMSQLDGCLTRWKELLDPITLAVVVRREAAAGGWPVMDTRLRSAHRCRPVCTPVCVQRDDACLDAVGTAAASLADEGQVLSQARQLSRCLAFRQLLAEALTAALAATFPTAGATVDAVASNMAVHASAGAAAAGSGASLAAQQGRHVCDLFDLPRPGLQGVGSPAVADPIVVNTLVGALVWWWGWRCGDGMGETADRLCPASPRSTSHPH
jgi:hypothetical protein